MPRFRLAAVSAALFALAISVPASALSPADPIMPLDQVRAGMHCTGYSVIRGTAISSFDVDVIDVLSGTDPEILVRAGGPAVEGTGIAEGFSGSPVKCDSGDGTPRIIGAIAQGTGDYGNLVVLVTPIQTMLGEPAVPPTGAKPKSTAAAARAARPLGTPLSFAGVSGPVATALQKASKKAGRALYAAPAAPRAATFAPQTLVPGASVAVGLSSGDISAGAVGTVTYVDGSTVWAFGHPLDGAGRRSLLLQDAYVYTVIGNPLDTQESTSYKLAAPGHDLGTLSNDAPAGIVGSLGTLPDRYPLRVTATDLDTGRVVHQNEQIADEAALGLPTGTSSLTQVAPVATAQAAYDILRGSPTNQSGELCMRVTLRERKKPLRFCNTYVGGSPAAAGAPMVADVATATTLLDSYNFGPLHVTGADVNLKLRRDLRQAFLLGASGPKVVRRGSDVKVVLRAQRVRGERFMRTVRVHIPRYLTAGEHTLTLTGAPADGGGSDGVEALSSLFTLTLGDDSGDGSGESGPTSVSALAADFAATAREDGVTASFRDPGDSDGSTASTEIEVLRDENLRLSGKAKLHVLVVP